MDNVLLSNNEMYIGKGYLSDGILKINLMTIVTYENLNNKNVSSTSMLESSDLWHVRLGHVNDRSLRKLINMDLLPRFDCSNKRCQVCIESKFTKLPFHFFERNNALIRIDGFLKSCA